MERMVIFSMSEQSNDKVDAIDSSIGQRNLEELPSRLDRLLPLFYDELKRVARHQKKGERLDHTLQTTALVHEAYARLAGNEVTLQDQQHVLAVSSRIIRNILVDYARRRSALKRQSPETVISESEQPALSATVLDLDSALHRLGGHSRVLEKVVEYRFFGGMTVAETAQVMSISPRSVERAWARARTYLFKEMATARQTDVR